MTNHLNRQFNRREFVARAGAAAGVLAGGLGGPTIIRAASAESWGDLVGRLAFDGKSPERKKLKVDKDVECCGEFDIRDESLIVGEDQGLGNVFIYVRSRRVKIYPELAEKVEKQVTLDNLDCIFIPHCMAIWHDEQEFYVVNSDPVAQNVDFAPLGDKKINQIIPVGGDMTHRFRKKQRVPVPIACNYHPWESGFILPTDNPYTAITKADGTFQIPRLPVGKLEFQVWHERIGYLKTPAWKSGRFELTIKPGTNDLGTIKIDPSSLVKA